MPRVTLNAINKALRAEGAQEMLVRGAGYFYFTEGEASDWHSSAVGGVFRLGDLSIESWVKEWRSKKADHARLRGQS